MSNGRDPLSARSLNSPLYPIFLGKGDNEKKRARSPARKSSEKRPRIHSDIGQYFPPTRIGRPAKAEPPVVASPSVWRRGRARLGVHTVTRGPSTPILTPSPGHIAIRSMHADQDFDPALALAFNAAAKSHHAGAGVKRLLALGGEEGNLKVVDVDNGEETNWRGHGNGVFDLKWAANDNWLVTASADQTVRIHDVSRPSELAKLVGHTSTIKALAFLDPSRGAEPSTNVIASGGRDGNINIYDLRCQGIPHADSDALRRSSRTRSSPTDGISSVLTLKQPHNATSKPRSRDLRSVSRTITSLVALQCMPGILASGGSYDGVVKLWDIRCPESASSLRAKCIAYGTLPDPTTFGANASMRGRSVNGLCEQSTTGDLYALCGDSKIHVLRPCAAKGSNPEEAIMPQKFVHPNMVISDFYIRMALSPDGQTLAAGSRDGGVMMWDTSMRGHNVATPLRVGTDTPEVFAVDWAKDMIAASSDDAVTRLWHSGPPGP